MEGKSIGDIILEQIEFHRAEIAELESEIKLLVTEKQVPLELRWDLFRRYNDGNRENWATHFPTILGISDDDIYDGMYIEKYETLNIFDFLERLEGMLYENNNIYEEAVSHFEIPLEEGPTDAQLMYVIENLYMPPLKEFILDEFIYEFTFDW